MTFICQGGKGKGVNIGRTQHNPSILFHLSLVQSSSQSIRLANTWGFGRDADNLVPLAALRLYHTLAITNEANATDEMGYGGCVATTSTSTTTRPGDFVVGRIRR